jgi:hypothetical protein
MSDLIPFSSLQGGREDCDDNLSRSKRKRSNCPTSVQIQSCRAIATIGEISSVANGIYSRSRYGTPGCRIIVHMKKLSIFAAVILVGCASSGPVQIGNNAYMITKQSAGGLAVPGIVVKTDIIAEANVFCSKSGKQTELISSASKNAVPFVRTSSAEITFRCI